MSKVRNRVRRRSSRIKSRTRSKVTNRARNTKKLIWEVRCRARGRVISYLLIFTKSGISVRITGYAVFDLGKIGLLAHL